MYIVVEGHDLAGKGVFINKLKTLYGRHKSEPLIVTEPYMGHPTGVAIRQFLAEKHTNSEELYRLYRENRNYLWLDIIRPALQQGKMVISDRNYLSSMVYQEKMGMMNVMNHNNENIPDMLYLITTDHETYLERLKKKKGLEVIEKALAKKENFDHLVRRYSEAAKLIDRLTRTMVINVKG